MHYKTMLWSPVIKKFTLILKVKQSKRFTQHLNNIDEVGIECSFYWAEYDFYYAGKNRCENTYLSLDFSWDHSFLLSDTVKYPRWSIWVMTPWMFIYSFK